MLRITEVDEIPEGTPHNGWQRAICACCGGETKAIAGKHPLGPSGGKYPRCKECRLLCQQLRCRFQK